MIDSGGYVYPQETGYTHGDGTWIVAGGKTLLDDFAGQAMQVLLTDEWSDAVANMAKDTGIPPDEVRAKCSYDTAVAMIAEKRKREE